MTADFYKPAMSKQDITALTLDDSFFDLIICSHVLDHIPNDRKAMSELHRVLKPGGTALILCLVDQENDTRDGPPCGAPTRKVGNHCIRVYGRDLPNRLMEIGFRVEVVDESKHMPENEIRLFGIGKKNNPHLLDQNTIYCCVKEKR